MATSPGMKGGVPLRVGLRPLRLDARPGVRRGYVREVGLHLGEPPVERLAEIVRDLLLPVRNQMSLPVSQRNDHEEGFRPKVEETEELRQVLLALVLHHVLGDDEVPAAVTV